MRLSTCRPKIFCTNHNFSLSGNYGIRVRNRNIGLELSRQSNLGNNSYDYFDPRVKVQATNILSIDHKHSAVNSDRYPRVGESIHYDMNVGIPAGRKRWENYKRFHTLNFGDSRLAGEEEIDSSRNSYLSKKGRTLVAVACSMPLSNYRDLVKELQGRDPFPLKVRHHHRGSSTAARTGSRPSNAASVTSTSSSVKTNDDDPMITTIAPLWNLHVHSKFTWEFVTNTCELN